MDYLLNQASLWLSAQRRDALALDYAERSLAMKEARLGPDHPTVAMACNNLAIRHWRGGRLAEAEALAARAAGIGEAGAGSAADQAMWIGVHGLMAKNLAQSLRGAARAKKLTRAADRYRQAALIQSKDEGRTGRHFTATLNNLATLRGYQGRWELALALHGRALALRRSALPAGDPETAASLHLLGTTLLESGRGRLGYRGRATLALLEEALAIREDAFADNPRHPNRLSAAGWLASAHWALAALEVAQADPARADALCAAYALDAEQQKAHADTYATRARAFEADGTEPPGQIDLT